MEKINLRIGYASTRRNIFSAEEAEFYKNKTLDKIKGLTDAEIVDIDDINSEGLLYSEDDLPAIADKFKKAGVDGLFCPHCNFGTEDLVAKLAKSIGKPLLIWGPRDHAPLEDGSRARDTQCGLFATGKVLRRFNVPYTYLPNDTLDSLSFTRGFSGFVAVCSVVKAFQAIRVLQIAPRPSDFWTMMVNEGELLERFDVQVFPVTLINVIYKVKDILKNEPPEFAKALEEMKSDIDCSHADEDSVKKIVALRLGIAELVKKNHCTAIAIQCWTDLQDALGIMPCIANGIFCEIGIPMVCEVDIHGAISAIMLQEAAMRTTPIFFADLTVRHPENDNAELLWHCGNFPQSLAKNREDRVLSRHFVFPTHCVGTGNWELKEGDITICRFDGDNGEYTLFIGEGHTCPGPKTQGTYVWLEVNDWLMWEKKLVEGSYVHHCAGVHAHVAPILHEACKYIPHLRPDPAYPTADEITQWWLGR
jgi:L-fucose isomerase-like protein